jgi:hypothetical protein
MDSMRGTIMIDREGDRQVLRQLALHGSDLSKPHHTTHFYFKSQEAAHAVASKLKDEGCDEIRIEPAPLTGWWQRLFGPREWSCIAETHAVPSEKQVFATTDRYNRLASKHGGKYDGWEAGIVRS